MKRLAPADWIARLSGVLECHPGLPAGRLGFAFDLAVMAA